jgi:alpha(1,3/1,4) fucosyltransferase
MALRICFTNFWPGAVTSTFFLSHVFGEAFGELEMTDDPASAEVVVSSLFGNREIPAAKTIMYLGENQRPDFLRHRYALSFDYDTYGGRNFRLPLWWWRLAWPGLAERWRRGAGAAGDPPHSYEQLIPLEALLSPRPAPQQRPADFCVLIAANPEALRINMFLALQSVGAVIGYGKMFNNPLHGSKFDMLGRFRFCLCPENSIYPGYHTEKLLDAWFGGGVPLYSGDRMLGHDFNTGAFLNYQDYLDMERFVAHVRHLETNNEAYEAIRSQPLLLRRPTLEPLIAFLRRAVDQIRSS